MTTGTAHPAGHDTRMDDDDPAMPTSDDRDLSPPIGAVQFGSTVRLTKGEAFDACQALAAADRFLVRAGRIAEATALGDLFELFEERLSAG